MKSPPKFIPTQYPAVRLLFGVATGIYFQLAFSWNIVGFAIAFGLCVAVGIGLFILKRYTASFWICSLVIGFWVGFSSLGLHLPSRSIGEVPAVIEGEVTSVLREDSLSFKCIVEGKVDAQAMPAIDPCRIIMSVYNPTKRENFLKTGARIYSDVKIRLPQKSSLPGELNEAQYCAANDVQFIAIANPKKVALLESSSGFSNLMYASVDAINNGIRSLYPKETSGVVSALLLGDQTKINPETRKAFSLSGTSHLLSVSGFHVAIISSGVFIILGFIRKRWIKFVVFTVFLTIFIMVSGSQHAALRAGIMAELTLIAYLLQQRIKVINIIALTVVVEMILLPGVIYSAAFQMSVASIVGITLLYNPFRYGLSMILPVRLWLRELLITSLALTFAASVIVSPIVAYYFSVFSVVSPLANLLTIPLMSIAMIWAFCSLIFIPINWGIATTFAAAASSCIHVTDSINTWAVDLQIAAVQSPNLAIPVACICSVALLYILFSNTRRQAMFRTGVASAVLLLTVQIMKPQVDIKTTFAGGETIPLVVKRKYVDAKIFPLKERLTGVLITDRKPHQYPFSDPYLQQYLAGLNDSLLIGVSGNSSEWVATRVRDKHVNVKIFTCPISLQNEFAVKNEVTSVR